MKNIIISIICFTIMVLAVSCNRSNINNDEISSDKVLNVYRLDRFEILSKIAKEFNEKNEDIKINERIFFPGEEVEFKNKLVTEIMAGSGPDIIQFRSYDFGSIHKIVSNGVFCNLNDLISQDKHFDFSLYNKVALDVGNYENKRCFMPLSFQYHFLVLRKEKLEADNILDEKFNLNWQKLGEIAAEFKKNNIQYLFDNGLVFTNVLLASNLKIYDWVEKKSYFKSNEIMDLMTIFKKIYPLISKKEFFNFSILKQEQQIDDSFLFMIEGGYGAANISPISTRNKFFRNYFNEDMYAIAIPNYSSNKNTTLAFPNILLAINENCKNKTKAFEYIKIALSEEIQKSKRFPGIPVNLEAEKYHDSLVDYFESYMTKDLEVQIKKIRSNVKKLTIYELDIMEIIGEEMNLYLNNKKTLKQTVQIIHDKINIYLNE